MHNSMNKEIKDTGFEFMYKDKRYGLTVIGWDNLSDEDKESLYKDTKQKMIIEINKTL